MDAQLIKQYAVVGNPVAHSLSPRIHHCFAQQTGQALHYSKVLAPLDDFEGTILQLKEQGLRGVNVTLPFKQQAFQLADHLTARARIAGAVNTLKFNENASIEGDNTDGAGLVHDIEHQLKHTLRNKSVLLIGAGGAARGALAALIRTAPSARFTVCARDVSKAKAMSDEIDKIAISAFHKRWRQQPHTEVISFSELEHGNLKTYDIVINATSSGLSGDSLPLPDRLFSPTVLAYDMVYGRDTTFMALARSQGAQVADGLGMLVEQAAEAFLFWHGKQYRSQLDTQAVLATLRAEVPH